MPDQDTTSIHTVHRRSYKHKYPYRSFLGLLLLALGLVLSVVVLGMTQDLRNRAASGEYISLSGRAVPGTRVSFTIDRNVNTANTTDTDSASGSSVIADTEQQSTTNQVDSASDAQTSLGRSTMRTAADEQPPKTNCPPGDRTCRNGYWYVCTDDGQSYQKRGACSNNDNDPSHGAKDCEIGEVKCDGNKYYFCEQRPNERLDWARRSELDYRCDPNASSTNSDGTCRPGYAKCAGAEYLECVSVNGTTTWLSSDSPGDDRRCNLTQPSPGEVCNYSERKCSNGKVYRCACGTDGSMSGNCSWQTVHFESGQEVRCGSDFYQDAADGGAGNGGGGNNNGGNNGGGGGGGGADPVALSCSPAAYTQLSGTNSGNNNFSLWSTIVARCSGANLYRYAIKDSAGSTHYYSAAPEAEARYIARYPGTFTVECTPVN